MTKEYLQLILKGAITGVLSAYLVLFGLRPAVPYPEFILELFENLWMFIILIIINYYIFIWDYNVGAILLLCILALMFDFVVFTNKGFQKKIKYESRDTFSNFEENEHPVVYKEVTKSADDESTFYDILMKNVEALNFAFPGGPAPLKQSQ
jgi:hypothetical protein